MNSARLSPVGLEPFAITSAPHLAAWRRGEVGPLIVAVHGGLDRGGSFARVARRLDGCRFVTYDRRGYQSSRSLTDVSLAHHRDDLLALLDDVVTDEPALILGHSYGGVVAIDAALTATPLIGSLVTYEPPLPWVVRRTGRMGPLSDSPADEAESFFRRMISDAAWERLSPAEQESRRLDGPALYDDLSTIRRDDAPFNVNDVSVPWTYSYGEADERRDYYASVAAELSRRVAEVRIAPLANAGHGAHLANPEGLARIVREHLEEL